MHTKMCGKLLNFLSVFSTSFVKDNIDTDLVFDVRVRAYKKRVSGKQPKRSI